MSKFVFFDYDGALIRNIDASDCLPDNVARIDIHGPFDSTKSTYKLLTTMLKSSTRFLDTVNICRLSAESPEFLAFLVLLCNKPYSLFFQECRLAVNATSCLMAALLAHDRIGKFSFSLLGSPMPTDQAKILLEGVASSPCLKFLDFNVREFTNSQEVGRYFIDALRRNQNLEGVNLHTSTISEHDPTFLPDVVKASILGPNMLFVKIFGSGQGLPLDVLEDVLCRQDCTVRQLNLFCVEISTEDRWGSMIQNVSVTCLRVCGTSSDWDKFGLIISLFKSLEQLNLWDNQITQLSFLDPLLFGECSKLRSLDVSENLIGEEEMGRFIEKLRTIRGLKHLAIGKNAWEESEEPVHKALINALRHNTDLEHVDFDSKELPLHLNRGGRRIFESSQPFPTNLLPLILKRASTISYYERDDEWEYPSNTKARADVVFWMIKRIAPQL